MKPKILITGGDSFLSRSLYPLFKKDNYNVISYSKEKLNLLDKENIKQIFEKEKPAIVIHTATKGGRRIKEDTIQDFYDNLLMLDNLVSLEDYYNKLFTFGSGAQFDLKERSYYGRSKLIQSKLVKDKEKITNLILFNVFGELETEDRFIKTAIRNYISNRPIEIWDDKFFDFFYHEDVYEIIKFLIHVNFSCKEFKLCYDKKLKLSETAAIINNLSDYKVPVLIKDSSNKSYTGNNEVLQGLKLKLTGLEQGIKQEYKWCLENKI